MPIAIADTTAMADAFIEARLVGDSIIVAQAPGGVWDEAAEQDTAGRIIRYVYQSGGSARQHGDFGVYELINNEIVEEYLIYLVMIVGENEPLTALEPGSTRIKQLLHRAPVTQVPGGQINSCRYLAPHKELVPESANQTYPERGGYYEITVQPLP